MWMQTWSLSYKQVKLYFKVYHKILIKAYLQGKKIKNSHAVGLVPALQGLTLSFCLGERRLTYLILKSPIHWSGPVLQQSWIVDCSWHQAQSRLHSSGTVHHWTVEERCFPIKRRIGWVYAFSSAWDKTSSYLLQCRPCPTAFEHFFFAQSWALKTNLQTSCILRKWSTRTVNKYEWKIPLKW